MKEEISRQKTDLVTIHDLIEKHVVQPHLDELVKTIYQMGGYRLSADYNHLEVDPLQWTQMTSQQRDAKIKKRSLVVSFPAEGRMRPSLENCP